MDGLFGVGPLELIIVIALALVVLGPERLPDTIRQVVRFIKQTRAIGNELTKQFSEELNMLDDLNPKKLLEDVVDLDEEFDGKELLGIKKDDLKVGDVDMNVNAKKPSKSNSLSPPKGPKTPPLQSIAKKNRTKPALGETDPEDTTTSAAVIVDESAEQAPLETTENETASTDSQSAPEMDAVPSSSEEPVTENRIAPPTMSAAQSLAAGKAVQTKSAPQVDLATNGNAVASEASTEPPGGSVGEEPIAEKPFDKKTVMDSEIVEAEPEEETKEV